MTLNSVGQLTLTATSGNQTHITLEGSAANTQNYRIQQGIVGVSNGGLSFRDMTNSVTQLAIDSSGNLLVGTTSGTGKTVITQSENLPVLSLNNTNTSFTDGALIIYNTRATTNSTYNHFACYNGNFTGQFIVRDSGNAVNTNNSYGAISDLKLKENITDVSPKLAKLLQVRVVNYTLKADPDKTKLIGVIAQELEQISPGLIEETPDYKEVKKTREVEVPAVDAVLDDEGNEVTPETTVTKYRPWGVDKTAFTFHLIAGHKYLKAENESLKVQLSVLEARLAALEAK
jgi:hypothetical protein